MLKPRKAKQKWQVVKRCFPNSSRAESAVIYLPKGQGRAIISHASMRKVCKQIENSLLNPSGRDDFFMHSGVVRAVFRMHRSEWMLSWVADRPHLYHLRKFPKPRLLEWNYEELLGVMSGWSAEPTAETERLSPRRETGERFVHIGINAHRDEGVTSSMDFVQLPVPDALKNVTVDRDAEINPYPQVFTTTPDGRVFDVKYARDCHNAKWTLTFLGFEGIRLEQISTILTSLDDEQPEDDVLFMQSIARWKRTLPNYETYGLVWEAFGLPITDEMEAAILAKAQEAWEGSAGAELRVPYGPTKENLGLWLVKYGELNPPYFCDYLSPLTPEGDANPERANELRDLYQRCKSRVGLGGGMLQVFPSADILKHGIDTEVMFTERSRKRVLDQLVFSRPSAEDVEAIVKIMKARQADPNAETFIVDSLAELVKKDEDEKDA